MRLFLCWSLLIGALFAVWSCAAPPQASQAPAAAAPPPALEESVVRAPAQVATVSPAKVLPILRESDEKQAEATRYVTWPGSHAAQIHTLTALTADVARATRALQASRRHGRYGANQVVQARAAVDALSVFLANKGD